MNTPNLNTVTQTPNLPPSYKEVMINNIQVHITLIQQQPNALVQNNSPERVDPENNMAIPPVATQGMSDRNKEGNKDHDGESSTIIPVLDDSNLAQKVEKVIQKAHNGPRKEGECVLEGATPFVSRIVRIKILSKFKLPQLD